MKLKLFPTNITEELQHASLHNNKIIYYNNKNLYFRRINDINNPIRISYIPTKPISHILSYNNNLAIVEGNELKTFLLSYDNLTLIDSVVLTGTLLKIFSVDDYLILLFKKNKLQIKKKLLEDVEVICKHEIKDIFFYDVPFLLTTAGDVYECDSFFMTKIIECKKKIILMPQRNIDCYTNILLVKNKLAVYSNDSVSVYEKKKDVFSLLYELSNYPIDLITYNDKIYSIKYGFNDLTNGPIKLLDCTIFNYLGSFFLTKNKIYHLIDAPSTIKISPCKNTDLFVKDPALRVEELLLSLKNYKFPRLKEDDDMIQALISIHNQLYFQYEIISQELKSILLSVKEKMDSLLLLEKAMKEVVNKVDNLKSTVVYKQSKLKEKVLKEERKIPNNFNTRNIQLLIDSIRSKLYKETKSDKREEINELRIINSILKRKINKEK